MVPLSIHITPRVANHALQAAAQEEVLLLWQQASVMRMTSFV